MLVWAPAAVAEPTDRDVPPPPPGSTTLAISDLGAAETISFDPRRDFTSKKFSFTVPRGLVPATLNATLEVPINLRDGALTVTQNDRTISRLKLPPGDNAPMVIPLAGLEVLGDWASVTLTMTYTTDTYCWNPEVPIRLANGSITFTGNEIGPTTVAGFLPPALRAVTIALPPKPVQAESQAAIQLAAEMATVYGWQKTAINVVPLPEGATGLPNPAGPGERQIIVKESADKGLQGLSLQPSSGMPALLISGAGDELTNQTRLLTDASLQYALSSKAVAGPISTDRKPVGETTTLKALKQTNLSQESLRPAVNIRLDQSMFAQPVDGIRVHLIGSYTPLPANLNGEVIAAVGDDVLDRWPVNSEGTIDRWVNVPNTVLNRSTTLQVRVHNTGDLGNCNDYLNMALRIDDSTEVTANPAHPPVPPGFRSFPQALMPRVQIGLGDDAFADTVRAAQIIVGLQHNSSMPLVTTVTTVKQAIASGEPAIVVSAGGWTDQTFALPFSADLGRITIAALDVDGNPATLNLEPAITFGSLQVIYDGQRSILVATSNGAPGQLDELLRWLSEKQDRWSDLEGRAIISVPGSAPVTVPNRRSDLPVESDASGPGKSGQSGQGWVWKVAGGVAALALVGALLILLRTNRPRTRVSEGQETAIDQETEGDPK